MPWSAPIVAGEVQVIDPATGLVVVEIGPSSPTITLTDPGSGQTATVSISGTALTINSTVPVVSNQFDYSNFVNGDNGQWNALTPLAGWTQDPNEDIWAIKLDRLGFVNMRGGLLSGTTADITVIGVVPANFRPAKDLINITAKNGAVGVGRIVVRHLTGNIEIYDVSGVPGLQFYECRWSHPSQL